MIKASKSNQLGVILVLALLVIAYIVTVIVTGFHKADTRVEQSIKPSSEITLSLDKTLKDVEDLEKTVQGFNQYSVEKVEYWDDGRILLLLKEKDDVGK